MRATEIGEQTPLLRTYRVTVPVAEIDGLARDRVEEFAPRIALKGFRPGRVPPAHLRKIYSKQVVAEVIDRAVADANRKIVADNGLRTCEDPKVTLPDDEAALGAMMAGTGDLTYTVEMAVVPRIELVDFAGITLTRRYADFTDVDLGAALGAIAELHRPPKPDDGEQPPAPALDDDFARRLGHPSMDKFREHIREHGQTELVVAGRRLLKRAVLDMLEQRHPFPLPPILVDQELKTIWTAVEGDLKAHKQTWEALNTTEDVAYAAHRLIAERRVRVGLVITEIGERHGIVVTDTETQNAIEVQIGAVPAEHQGNVRHHFRTNPAGVASLRAPLWEDKIVDWVLEHLTVIDQQVSREALLGG
jgi:FKBP-type peptidyl-prolyl cis-trans isomerase (trigger factor)